MMALDPEGKRQRYFHERLHRESSQGNPLRANVSLLGRKRIVTAVQHRAHSSNNRYGEWKSFVDEICKEIQLVFPNEKLLKEVTVGTFEHISIVPETSHFLSVLEISINKIFQHRNNIYDIQYIQSLLADDLSLFRIRESQSTDEDEPPFLIQRVDNEHLQAEIVDRAFELTRDPLFKPTQRDYSEAWKHFSSGDFDDALVNAHKAFESTAKIAIKTISPNSSPEHLQTNQLIPPLREHNIIPSRLETILVNLEAIFRSAGTLRNMAGTGHGSLDLSSPEASVALLGLRLSGSLICFIAERTAQLRSQQEDQQAPGEEPEPF